MRLVDADKLKRDLAECECNPNISAGIKIAELLLENSPTIEPKQSIAKCPVCGREITL